MPRVTRPLLVGGGVYGLALVLIALWPTHVDENFNAVSGTFVGRWLLDGGFTYDQSYWLIEFWSNVALYAPLGVLAMLLSPGTRWWQAVALAFGISVVFELLQGLLLPGRTAAPLDVFANTLGAAIGAGLFVLARFATTRIGPLRTTR